MITNRCRFLPGMTAATVAGRAERWKRVAFLRATAYLAYPRLATVNG